MSTNNEEYSIAKTLSEIREQYGDEAVLDSKRCIGLFADIAPKQTKDRWLLLMFLNSGGSRLPAIQDPAQRKDEALRIVDQMVSQYPITQEHANRICAEYASVFGLNISRSAPKPNPESDPKHDPKHDPKPDPEPDLEPDLKPDPEHDSEPDSRPSKRSVIITAIIVILFLVVLFQQKHKEPVIEISEGLPVSDPASGYLDNNHLSTSSFRVLHSDPVTYAVDSNGIYKFQNGVQESIYEGNLIGIKETLCLQGKKLYTVDSDNRILEVDVNTGDTARFPALDLGPYSIIGIRGDQFYLMAHKNTEQSDSSQTYDRDILVYDRSAQALFFLAEGTYASFWGDYLMVSQGHYDGLSDLQLYAPNNTLCLDRKGVSDFYMHQDTFYYLIQRDDEIVEYRFSQLEDTEILSIPYTPGHLYSFEDDLNNNSIIMEYTMNEETGEEIPTAFYDASTGNPVSLSQELYQPTYDCSSLGEAFDSARVYIDSVTDTRYISRSHLEDYSSEKGDFREIVEIYRWDYDAEPLLLDVYTSQGHFANIQSIHNNVIYLYDSVWTYEDDIEDNDIEVLYWTEIPPKIASAS